MTHDRTTISYDVDPPTDHLTWKVRTDLSHHAVGFNVIEAELSSSYGVFFN